MNRLLALYKSTLGKKFIVAVTGIKMLGFLLGHVAGNLKIFLPPVDGGQPDIDYYAHFLRKIGEPLFPHAFLLWIARIGLIVALVAHVICVMQLATTNLAARNVDYSSRKFSRATPPARWMMYTGCFLLMFIVVHLLHFTFGVFGNFEHGNVYQNLHGSFTNVLWVAFYVVSLAIVALHLYHGVWSLFQTLGFDNPDRNRGLRRMAAVLAVGLFAGFIAVPTAFLTGIAKAPAAIEAETEANDSIEEKE